MLQRALLLTGARRLAVSPIGFSPQADTMDPRHKA
jgi:hypothetical protein